MRRAIIQAGLFGAAIAVLLDLIAMLPYVGWCISVPLFPVAFFLTGLALVRVLDFNPSVSDAAAGGAVAGVTAGAIGGLAAMFLAPVRLALSGGADEVVQLLPPDMVNSLIAQGLDPVAVVDFLGKAGLGISCCAAQLITGALLAGSAAALYAAYRRT
jgi:hypothetical protein